MSGTLYVVATPIGNLEDITQRAIQTLTNVDLVAAEDTRHSKKLLAHFGIKTRLFPLHDHNEKDKTSELIHKLKSGNDIALISDAGTPLISDPGYHLVNECRSASITVAPVPGASAVITALSAAGLPSDRFSFFGFVPAKQKAREDFYSEIKQIPHTTICYESPRRLKDSLNDGLRILGDTREVVLAKELTKSFEHFVKGNISHILSWLDEDEARYKGEMVLLIAGDKSGKNAELTAESLNTLKLLKEELPLKKAAALAAQIHGVRKNILYNAGLDE